MEGVSLLELSLFDFIMFSLETLNDLASWTGESDFVDDKEDIDDIEKLDESDLFDFCSE